jgi:hypothetical protein
MLFQRSKSFSMDDHGAHLTIRRRGDGSQMLREQESERLRLHVICASCSGIGREFSVNSGIGWRSAERKEPAMCDYSLHLVASRPAQVGDKLVTTEFWNTTTRGFSPVAEPNMAVCLLPGTEVAFENEVKRKLTGFQLRFFKGEPERIRHTVARFRQVNMDNPCTHHDALEFPDGEIVLLTHLRAGQHAAVLQLPAQAKSPSGANGSQACVDYVA